MRNLILIFTLLFLLSCSTTRYIEKEIPIVETITLYKINTIADSTYIHDSIFVYINGDTVYKYKLNLQKVYVYKTDTVIKVDSIPYPVTIKETCIQEVKKLTWLDKLFEIIGIIVSGVLLPFALFKLNKLWVKK